MPLTLTVALVVLVFTCYLTNDIDAWYRNSMNESANTETAQISPGTEVRVKNPALLARMVIREGKSFKESALAAGYAESVAQRGLRALASASRSVADAVNRESNSLISLDKLKPLAVRRLHDEIVNPKSSLGIKAIELAGRFKETDWFVRNVDVQIGVFAQIGESSPAEESISAYKDDE